MRVLLIVMSLFLLSACNGGNENEIEQQEESNDSVKSDLSISFNEPDVTYVNDMLIVKGEARTTEANFYYTLLDDETVLIEETEIEFKDKNVDEWRQFEIEGQLKEGVIEEGELPILKMYVKDNGKIVNPNFIPIDLSPY